MNFRGWFAWAFAAMVFGTMGGADLTSGAHAGAMDEAWARRLKCEAGDYNACFLLCREHLNGSRPGFKCPSALPVAPQEVRTKSDQCVRSTTPSRYQGWQRLCGRIYSGVDIRPYDDGQPEKLTLLLAGDSLRLLPLEQLSDFRQTYTYDPPILAKYAGKLYVLDDLALRKNYQAPEIYFGTAKLTFRWSNELQWYLDLKSVADLLAFLRDGRKVEISYGASNDRKKITLLGVGFDSALQAN
jgi:hypothetical protein